MTVFMKGLKFAVFMICAAAAIALSAAKLVNPGHPDQQTFQLVPLTPSDFNIEIRTIGDLDAARSHMISSEIRGDKGKIIDLVDDGQRVAPGDVLVRLDPTPFEEDVLHLKTEAAGLKAAVEAAEQILEWEKSQIDREIKTAAFNLKIARLELRKLVEGDGPMQTAQLREAVEKNEEEYERYKSYITDLAALAEKGYRNSTELKLAEKKASELKEKYHSAENQYTSYTRHVFPALQETAKARVEKAEMELEQIRKGSVFKIAKAIAALNETKTRQDMIADSLSQAREELDKTIIKAPFPGIAILYETFRDGQKRKPRVGDRVLKNQPLLYLPDISAMIVKTLIREIDLHKAALGQRCRVMVDAYPDALLEGEVVFIGVMAANPPSRSRGEKYFQLTIALKEEDPRLRPGMTARISILADRIENTPALPVQAVFEESGAFYCYRLAGDKFDKVAIETGRQNEDLVEILSGLTVGDRVNLVQPSPENIRQE